MSTDLVYQPTVLSNEQLTYISKTEFVPAGLRGNLPAILACVATGRALGLDDMTAIRSIHVIEGKATFSAELMVMLVRRAGHSISGEMGEGTSTVVGKRSDNGDTMTVTWTMAMAKRAGLADKSNWKKYPESMLWARAVSQLCRMLFPDCFAGQTYTPEELGDEALTGEPTAAIDAEDGLLQPSADVSPVSQAPVAAGELASPVEETEAVGPPAPPPYIDEGWPADDGLFPPPGVPEGIREAQAKKLNVLVGTLRTAGHITTEQLWKRMRPGQEWPRDMEGELHWAPLRDGLSRDEASGLISRLEKLQQRVTAPDFAARAAEAIEKRAELDKAKT